MTIYEDTYTTSLGKLRIRTFQDETEYDPTELNLVASRHYVYREGVRRPKPKYLDDTPYELRVSSIQNCRGLVTVDNPSNPGWKREGTGVLSELQVGYDGHWRKGLPFAFNSEFGDVARVKALSKLNRKDLDLGAAWKERGQTAQLVGDIAHLSVRALQALRRKDLGGFRDAFTGTDAQGMVSGVMSGGRNVSDAYLAYHYGVKPMLQDVSGSVKAMTRLPPEEWRVRAVGQHSKDEVIRFKGFNGFWPRDIHTVYRESAKFFVSAVRRNLSRGDDIRWALGLDDPLSTAWEVAPFSFVFDWLMPVGDWLAALNGSKYYTNWQHSLTQYRKEVSVERSASGKLNGLNYKTAVSPGRFDTLGIKRTVGNSLPIVGVPIKDPRSLDHMAKGLALFASTLARGGEPPRFIRG